MLEEAVYSALQSLVGGRCYPLMFPQTNSVPQWPAIRYSVLSRFPAPILCGDTGEDALEWLLQIDAVAREYGDVVSLRLQIILAMEALTPTPAIYQNSFEVWDSETKTFVSTITYEVHKSSDPVT